MNNLIARQKEHKYKTFVETWCNSQSREEVIDKLTHNDNWCFIVGNWYLDAEDKSVQSLKKHLQRKGVLLKELPKHRKQIQLSDTSVEINYTKIAAHVAKMYKDIEQ